MDKEILLGVNIDHIATLRQARGTVYPDPVQAAIEAEEAGADGITLHLREDLRHIQVRDVHLIKAVLQTRMNLELALTPSMLDFAEEIKPAFVCFVPENRAELTTEGGLDVVAHISTLIKAVERLKNVGSEVSLFIDADKDQIDAAFDTGARFVEIHTGHYADAADEKTRLHCLEKIKKMANYAAEGGLIVNAGHGLHYHNVKPIAAIEVFHELNIGHAIIARALFCGLKKAVQDMRLLMLEARNYVKDR